MRKSQLFLAAASAALIVGLASPAAANAIPNSTSFTDPVTAITLDSYDFTTFGTALKVTSPTFTGNVTIGPFIDTLDSGAGPFTQLVFCDDLGNDIDPTHGAYNFWFTDLADPTGANDYLSTLTADEIHGIVGLVTDATFSFTLDQTSGAAYQLAIWNLEYGDTVTTDNTTVNALAAGFEADALNFYNNEFLPSGFNYVQLESPCDSTLAGQISFTATPFPGSANCQVQGQITIVPPGGTLNLPEPTSLAILGSGLIGFGAFRRRRRKAA